MLGHACGNIGGEPDVAATGWILQEVDVVAHQKKEGPQRKGGGPSKIGCRGGDRTRDLQVMSRETFVVLVVFMLENAKTTV